jgi:excisionase family DNA binding protein
MDLHEVAEELGAHYMTVYGWVREGRLPATKRGGRYDVRPEAVARLRAERERPVRSAERVVADWQPLARTFRKALLVGDESAARHQVRQLVRSGTSPLAVCDELVAPALRAIGEAWAAGRVDIVQEHRSSAICSRVLAPLAAPRVGRPRGRAVVLTAPGDRHRLPALMATIALRDDRWRVDHLDVDLPPADLTAFLGAAPPDLVVLSCTHRPAARAARRLATTIERSGVPTLVGAPAATLVELRAQAGCAPATVSTD